MANEYSDCYFCGGEIREERLAREIWWHGRLHLIEDVPVGVCRQCGQKVILPAVAKTIDEMLAAQSAPDAYAQVPTYHFRETQRVA